MRLAPHAAAAAAAGVAIAIVAAGPVLAHVHEHAGAYGLVIGWQNEPTYVGQANAVVVIVHEEGTDAPVTDLAPGDLSVVVSTGGKDSAALPLEPAFDVEEGFGTPGEYRAVLLPTAPGEYTFHISGSIRDQAVDLTVPSGDETFDSVQGTSEIEFPAKLPALSEIVTRLDRIDGRIEALAGGPSRAEIEAVRAAADQALLVGGGLGLAGLLVGALGTYLALRARTRPA